MFRKWLHGLLVGLLIGAVFVAMPGAQTYIWSSINGVPYASGGMVLGPGSATAPSLRWTDPDTGFYDQNGRINVSVNGSQAMTFELSGINFYGSDGITFRLPVLALTTARSMYSYESAKLFNNDGDADGSGVTLLGAERGYHMSACVVEAQTFTITASSGDTIRIAAAVTPAAGNISSNTIGNCVHLVAINDTEWVAVSYVGTWTVSS